MGVDGSRRSPGTIRAGRVGLVAALLGSLVLVAPLSASGAVVSTRIMVVGSSTSHGSAGDYTWRYRLWQRMVASGATVDFVGPRTGLYDVAQSAAQQTFAETNAYADPNFDRDHNARWGRFVGTFAGQFVGAKDTINGDVATHQPDYVLVMLGLNDLTWFTTRAPSLVAQDMSTLVANARAARANVRLVLVAVQPTRAALTDAALAARIAEYNNLLAGLANTQSTATSPIAYVAPAANYQPDYNVTLHDSYDGTHPNAYGEVKIANSVADILAIRFGLGSLHPGVAAGPVLPFQLTCTAGNGEAVLTWTESPGATGYWIQRRVLGQPWEPATYQLKMSDLPFRNVWLINGTTYEYRLQAAKWYDRGAYSNVCAVTPHA